MVILISLIRLLFMAKLTKIQSRSSDFAKLLFVGDGTFQLLRKKPGYCWNASCSIKTQLAAASPFAIPALHLHLIFMSL